MNNLQVPRRRRRGLSVNALTEDQKEAMTSSLDHLQDDIVLVNTQWSKTLTETTNPLEFALSFLDTTSVGLGHRLPEFHQLQSKIGYDLQNTVNEHYQEFNSNVASYGTAVHFITEAQEKILEVKTNLSDANRNITVKKGSLEELNENSQKYTNMLKILPAIEKLISTPEKIEAHIREENYQDAKQLLVDSYFLANTHSLWEIQSLKPIKEQLQMQDHSLFNNLIEDIHDLVYSKNLFRYSDSSLLKDLTTPEDDFTGAETYLNNIVNTDFVNKSELINSDLKDFIKELKTLTPSDLKKLEKIKGKTDNEKIFSLLSIINDMNKLSQASTILLDRAKVEIHSILLRTTDSLRAKHPSLLKLVDDVSKQNDFGISLENMLSIILRTMFWEIFLKLLVSMQGHCLIYEIIAVLQRKTSANNVYKINDIWNIMLEEIREFLTKYLRSPKIISAEEKSKNRDSNSNTDINGKQIDGTNTNNVLYQNNIYSLQDNIDNNEKILHYSNDLKNLFKDIFPGFTVNSSVDMNNIYIKEDSLEQDNSVIPASIFNMRLILEPFLLFSKAVGQILPDDNKKMLSSKAFFLKYINEEVFPDLQRTFTYLFNTRVRSNNPYRIHVLHDNRKILGAAHDFMILFANLLFITRTSHSYKKLVCSALLNLLDSFFKYYHNLFENLFGTKVKSEYVKQIITLWLQDEQLMKLEEGAVYQGKFNQDQEYELLVKYCPQFFETGRGLNSSDLFNMATLDAIINFNATISWVLEWLPQLRKVVQVNKGDALQDIDQLRNDWSLFESPTFVREERMKSLKICMINQTVGNFDKIINNFKDLRVKLMTVLRFDIRARCIYYIGRTFQENKNWYLNTDSFELDHNISSLRSDLIKNESKMVIQLPGKEKYKVFVGLDSTINNLFIKSSKSIQIINYNGCKKLVKNITSLQLTCRNLIFEDSSSVNMNKSINFYDLCKEDENQFFIKLNNGELKDYSKLDLETLLRLLYSEEINLQARKQKQFPNKTLENSGVTKRYQNAVQKLRSSIATNNTSNIPNGATTSNKTN